MPVPLRHLPIATTLLLLSACQHTPPDPASQQDPVPRPDAAETSPPSPERLTNATYIGLNLVPGNGSVTLKDGTWQGRPYVEGGAAAPRAGLVEDLYLTADLDGDGREEAVTLLWTSGAGSGTFDYLAVVDRETTDDDWTGHTTALGDRVRIRSARLSDNRIVLETVQAGPQDAACCPGQKLRRSFVYDGATVTELETEDLGRLSIADLEDTEWVLAGFGFDSPVPEDIEITLTVEGERIAGSAGCNRYFGPITAGDGPGTISLGPLATTRMACSPSINALEQRFLEDLGAVDRFQFHVGRLLLSWHHEGSTGILVFTPRAPPTP